MPAMAKAGGAGRPLGPVGVSWYQGSGFRGRSAARDTPRRLPLGDQGRLGPVECGIDAKDHPAPLADRMPAGEQRVNKAPVRRLAAGSLWRKSDTRDSGIFWHEHLATSGEPVRDASGKES